MLGSELEELALPAPSLWPLCAPYSGDGRVCTDLDYNNQEELWTHSSIAFFFDLKHLIQA